MSHCYVSDCMNPPIQSIIYIPICVSCARQYNKNLSIIRAFGDYVPCAYCKRMSQYLTKEQTIPCCEIHIDLLS